MRQRARVMSDQQDGSLTRNSRANFKEQLWSLTTMDAEQLFLERCRQIKSLMQSDREIDLLDLSALLRQLLNDRPLVHQANSKPRLKLTFTVGLFRNPPDQYTEVLSLEDGLDPDTRPAGSPSRQVDFDGFINHKVLFLKGQGQSVLDVIKLGANVAGGVHRTDNPREKQKLIAEYSAKFGIGGLPGAIKQLKAIARVALKGFQPLIEALENG
jgi:hypothetical protein